jgi:hypothetical protein
VNAGGQQPSSSTATTGGDSANRAYIDIHNLLENMDNDGGRDADEQGDVVLGPEDAEICL